MNVKKLLAKILATTTIISTLGMGAFSVSAKTVTIMGDIFNDFEVLSGTYFNMGWSPNTTTATTENSSYLGCYKTAEYSQYGCYMGTYGYYYYCIDSEKISGTTQGITTDYMSIGYDAARRIHKADIRYSSSESSPIKESHIFYITKP